MPEGNTSRSESRARHSAFAEQLKSTLALRPIPLLAGLRAVAVFLVIFYHFGLPIPGGQGVIIFFVLSGFLITWLLLKEEEKYGRVSLSGFYWRRMLRIFPAFYFYWISVAAILWLAGKNLDWSHAISSFFFFVNYYHATIGDPNNAYSHTWSLAIEEQFYLLWPVVFLQFRRNLKKLTVLLASVIGLVWLHRFFLYFVLEMPQNYFYAAFDTRVDGLLVGCLLAVLMKRGALMHFWQRVCNSGALLFLTFAALVTSVYMGEMIPGYRHLVGIGLHPILMAVMLVQMLSMSSAVYVRWLESGPMKFLGKISYSLFLYQQIVIYPVTEALSQYPTALQLLAAILTTMIFATFSYNLIEKPFLNMKARGSAKAKAKAESQKPRISMKQTA